MPLGEMQIDRRLFKVSMSEQHLDGAQVGAGLEQVCGKAVAQSVRVDMLVRKAGSFGGVTERVDKSSWRNGKPSAISIRMTTEKNSQP